MFSGKMPDITAAQVVAIVGSIIAMIVAYGVDLSQSQVDTILDFVKVIAPVLIGGDAALRASRNYRAAKTGERVEDRKP